MEKLTYEQAIEQLTKLFGENVKNTFDEQLKIAGEHGIPNFNLENNEGLSVEIWVDWDKESDLLSYTIVQ
ncbi:hypothetical protein [Ornithinibacillus bavariensis]|uniref:Uncharacterized protein n=1 Tax=Ornithinibacillus bavariensis TaxID=545502 RepID=A0A919X6D9_9BACI|nr:hypothetical protein [Ornithinibacillus bavariensis]GIO25874.1 hypothetical protein J43TS3_04850 [Ornithinibacillus bavariensis]HAM79721.1 hypothetical protein [Ornithinibacillus sp.]